jgi:uncharacterized protein
MELTRRTFLLTAAAAATVTEIDAQTGMPMRTLGKTKEKVSLIAFGAGSRWLAYKTPDKGLPALERALKGGVNYVDSAASYGNGVSEQWIGEFLKTHKKTFFLVTKIGGKRTYDDSMRLLDRSLKNLGVSQVDLLHMHSLGGQDDLAAIEAPEGQLKALLHAREQKMTRYIGVTSHSDPQSLKDLLTRHDLDCTQMALNIAQMGGGAPSNRPGEGMTGASGFEALALPVALKKNMGVTAMKVFAQEKLLGHASPEMLLRYCMTLPVAACTVGLPELAHIDFALATAKSFKPLTPREMKSLPGSVTKQMRASIDSFFANHQDC